MQTWQALFLGVLEGLTEFVPVSSTGHLILAVEMLGVATPPGKVFEIVIQLGAVLAVCCYYRARLMGHAVGMMRRDPRSFRFATAVLAGFLPAALLGAVLHDVITRVLFSPMVVAWALVVGGVAILIVEHMPHQHRHKVVEDFSLSLCLKIGLCQCLALIPGTSRSGATILGALLLDVDRRTAAEYSFFLAIPTMLGAAVYSMYRNRALLDLADAGMIVLGFLAAFASGLVVVHALLAYLKRHTFCVFAYYRILLGGTMLALLYGGVV